MSALAGHRRVALVAAVTALFALMCPVWPVATAHQGVRPPGVPPPVDLEKLPTGEVVNPPYLVHNRENEQIGPPERTAACAPRATGSVAATAATPLAQRQLGIGRVHQVATGHDQVVAVIDSGVNPHPRLTGRLFHGGDYLENRPELFDCDGHGTAVAGIIAAAPDPTTGFIGVAPEAKILSIRQASRFYSVPVRAATGELTRIPAGDTVSMARAVMRAVQLGATVINISEAACFPAEPDQVNAPDLQAAVHHAVASNVVVVAAAANEDDQCEQNVPGSVTTISSPGWFDDDVLTVAATDERREAAPFSIRGPWVDVAAPGTDITSLDAAGPGLTTELVDERGQRMPLNGTSFAAPYVAGLAALVRQKFPQLTAREVMHRIEQTTQHAAGPGGQNEALGWGVINPMAALTDVVPGERGPGPQPSAGPTHLEGLRLEPPDNPLPRTVALAGSAAALGLLGLTLLVVYTLKWHQRNRAQRNRAQRNRTR
ncbi:MAG: type VII secretion-associated serine protease mycosin [Pseudonocardiaceae bacterium]